jgi:hypothetical protein
LTFYESINIQGTIKTENQIKEWGRPWKLRLIEEKNAEWRYLYNAAVEQCPGGASVSNSWFSPSVARG